MHIAAEDVEKTREQHVLLVTQTHARAYSVRTAASLSLAHHQQRRRTRVWVDVDEVFDVDRAGNVVRTRV